MIDRSSAPVQKPTPKKEKPDLAAHVESVNENIALLEESIVACQKERDGINADIAAHRTEIAEWRRMLPRKRTTKNKGA